MKQALPEPAKPTADANGPEKIQASVPPPSADPIRGPEKIQSSVPPPSADASGPEKIQSSVPPPNVDLSDPDQKPPSSVHQALLRPGTVDMELLAAAIQIAKGGSDVPEQTGDMSAVQALEQALKNKMSIAGPLRSLLCPILKRSLIKNWLQRPLTPYQLQRPLTRYQLPLQPLAASSTKQGMRPGWTISRSS